MFHSICSWQFTVILPWSYRLGFYFSYEVLLHDTDPPIQRLCVFTQTFLLLDYETYQKEYERVTFLLDTLLTKLVLNVKLLKNLFKNFK